MDDDLELGERRTGGLLIEAKRPTGAQDGDASEIEVELLQPRNARRTERSYDAAPVGIATVNGRLDQW